MGSSWFLVLWIVVAWWCPAVLEGKVVTETNKCQANSIRGLSLACARDKSVITVKLGIVERFFRGALMDIRGAYVATYFLVCTRLHVSYMSSQTSSIFGLNESTYEYPRIYATPLALPPPRSLSTA